MRSKAGLTLKRIISTKPDWAASMAMAGLWELVEWQYAVIDGGDAGAAFLGSQGDEWDAQKDILCDTLGAICSMALFLGRQKGRAKEGHLQGDLTT